MPSPVADVHQTLNRERSPVFRACRERSKTMLEIVRVSPTGWGSLGAPAQSLEMPRRATNAAVNAANTMAVAATGRNNPHERRPPDDPRDPVRRRRPTHAQWAEAAPGATHA